MITPTYNHAQGLKDNLDANGLGHRAPADPAQRERVIYELSTGSDIGLMDYPTCKGWLQGLARAHEQRGIE